MFTVQKFLKMQSMSLEEVEKVIEKMPEEELRQLVKYFFRYIKREDISL
jgi:hypothetical protein